MQIIAGTARNTELSVPAGNAVRPTSGRARKALFDSLGDWQGASVLDLFSGSGAFALEAASRGASRAVMVELNPAHAAVIEENCRRIRRTGVNTELILLKTNAMNPASYANAAPVDLIFADPPYADSAAFFHQLTASELFRSLFAGVQLVWEIPDTPGARGEFMLPNTVLRKLGDVTFCFAEVESV